MTQNWVNQAVNSLGSIYNKNTDTGWHRNYGLKVGIIIKTSMNIDFYCTIFGPKLCWYFHSKICQYP